MSPLVAELTRKAIYIAFGWGALITGLLAMAALALGGVGRSGAVAGWVLGTLLFGVGGWRSFLVFGLFVVLGTAATRLGHARKARLGIAQERGGRRGARHALANTGAGVVFALLALATPYTTVFTLAMVAAFATATCDTVASEIGQAYGRRHYRVTTLEPVRPGTEGAVSLAGTLAGIVAAAWIAALALAVELASVRGAGIVVVAAFVGTTFESWLGATLARRGRVHNELMNFANTVAGALVAIVLWSLS